MNNLFVAMLGLAVAVIAAGYGYLRSGLILTVLAILALFMLMGCETMSLVGKTLYEQSDATASSQPMYACGGFHNLPASDAALVARAAQACAKAGY